MVKYIFLLINDQIKYSSASARLKKITLDLLFFLQQTLGTIRLIRVFNYLVLKKFTEAGKNQKNKLLNFSLLTVKNPE